MDVYGSRVIVLTGLDPHGYRSEAAEVFKHSSVDLLLDAEHQGHAEAPGELTVLQGVGERQERRAWR